MIIVTAGHVDHGKTSLLQALTGVNADRLPEEKARGMSIDLGYVYWPQPDGQIIGFIDVPGHEKFLSNMLSGIGGVDHALLMVAADDGVMPQTLEHLAILQLSGKPPLTAVITKSDTVEPARLEEVRQQVVALSARLGWPEMTIFISSVPLNAGIDELAAHLRLLAARVQDPRRSFRLAIDRVFTIRGAGVVVTGTALCGTVSVGDTLWLTGLNKPVRVRGLHAQNQPTDAASGGQRVALNLSGGVEKEGVARGDWLLAASPGPFSERAIVVLDRHHPLHQGQSLHIHHGARRVTGRLALLEGDLAELLFDSPLCLADNDRLILRDISARQTLAGASVLVETPPRRGKRQPDYLAWLHQLADAGHDDAAAIGLYLQQKPWRADALCRVRQLRRDALSAVLDGAAFWPTADYVMLAGMAHDWQQLLLSSVEKYHDRHGDRPGIGRDRLRRMALPDRPGEVVLALIDRLVSAGELVNNHGWLHLPQFEIRFEPQEDALWQRAEPHFTDRAWWVRDLARELDSDEELMRQTLRKAAQAGDIIAIVKDRYFSRRQIVQFASIIRQRAEDGSATSAGDFRDQLATGRKLAVQILEFFDRCGFTRRVGNEHVLRDPQMFS